MIINSDEDMPHLNEFITFLVIPICVFYLRRILDKVYMSIIGCNPGYGEYCQIYLRAKGQRLIVLSLLLGVVNVYRVARNLESLVRTPAHITPWVIIFLMSIFVAVLIQFIFSEIQRQISNRQGDTKARKVLITIVNVLGGFLLLVSVYVLLSMIFLTEG